MCRIPKPPTWFSPKSPPSRVVSYLERCPKVDASKTSVVQPYWTRLINEFLSPEKLGEKPTLNITDKHKYATIGTRKPDCPIYSYPNTDPLINMVAIGELKRRRSRNSQDFTSEEKGHLLEFVFSLLENQPWRKTSSITAFLSDLKACAKIKVPNSVKILYLFIVL